MDLGDGEHVFVGGLLFFFGGCLTEFHHGAEIFHLETHEAHGGPRAFYADTGELALTVADYLHIRRRGESRYFGEFAPRKNGTALALLVVIQHVLAEIGIFDYRFHQS